MHTNIRTNSSNMNATQRLQQLLLDDAQAKFKATREQALKDQEFFAVQASTTRKDA